MLKVIIKQQKTLSFHLYMFMAASDWLNGMKICKKDKTEIIENFL